MAYIDKIYITRDQYPECLNYFKHLGERHKHDIVSKTYSPEQFEFEKYEDFPVINSPVYIDIWILEDRKRCPDWLYKNVCEMYDFDPEDEELDLEIHNLRLCEIVEQSSLISVIDSRSIKKEEIEGDSNPLKGIVINFGCERKPRGKYETTGASLWLMFSEIGSYTADYVYKGISQVRHFNSLEEVLGFLDMIYEAFINPLGLRNEVHKSKIGF